MIDKLIASKKRKKNEPIMTVSLDTDTMLNKEEKKKRHDLKKNYEKKQRDNNNWK